MPQVDMPLSELEVYSGTNPRPDDFEAYWERALAEMRATEANIELKPAEFECGFADCYDLYFTGTGGSRVYAKVMKPKDIKSPRPALLLFHGYTMSSGNWTDHLHYVAEGFVVVAMDCRGQGGLSHDSSAAIGQTLFGHILKGMDDAPEKLHFRNVFLDTAQLAGIVMAMDEVDENRVATSGGSQGGALSLICAALEPRICKAAPVFPFLSDYKRVWEMDAGGKAYQGLVDYFRRFDPRHEREDFIFERLGYIDTQHFAKRIRAEVMMAVGLMDTVCPPSTQFAAYNKIESKKSYVLYPDFGHEGLPGHDEIIFQFVRELCAD